MAMGRSAVLCVGRTGNLKWGWEGLGKGGFG